MKNFRWLGAALWASLAAIASVPAAAQQRAPLMYDPNPSTYRVPAPPEVGLQAKSLSLQQATVSVNFLPGGSSTRFGDTCIAWNAQAQAAFSYAASIWASQLQSTVPITINACYANNMGPGVLGEAGPYTFFSNFAGAPDAGTWYPVALANARAGTDLDPAHPDIEAAFSSTFSWYYGTDGVVPFGTLDFVSVVLHEIGHGLGFTGSMAVDSLGSGSWGEGSGSPFRFDRYAQSGAGQSLIDTAAFPNPSLALGSALQSNSVYFSGPNANAANGGQRVALFAPSRWSGGSSYAHLAESFNGTPNALMTYSLSSGESIHSPGPVTLGVLQDLGWTLQNSSTADVSLTQLVGPNPASTGKDTVFTMTATNNGPGTATGVTVSASYDPSAAVVWASPACVKQGSLATYVCNVGTLGKGASAPVKLVLRKATTGSVSNNATVSAATADPGVGNNTANAAVSVQASPAAAQVQRYRLYSNATQEHLFTTDANEYATLGGQGWTQEGPVGHVLDNPGAFGGVTATPYYRLYNAQTRWHHWTTDPNEYYTLAQSPPWSAEGVDGWILPSGPAGTLQLYRLVYPYTAGGLHHWTIDPNEYTTLIASFGWQGEGGSGFVIR